METHVLLNQIFVFRFPFDMDSRYLLKLNLWFVCRTDSPLAKLYTTSTLEHHHFNHAVIILSTEVS